MKNKKRYLLNIYGIVQGVGFRPFVYNKAKEFQICGWVNNAGGSVVIDLTGTKKNIKSFILAIVKNPPTLASIEKVQCSYLEYCTYDDFTIKESTENFESVKFLSPDIGVCDKCVEEVMNRKGKRYKYAFTNCTECGPRYSIIKALPYDRSSTTMDSFKMCYSCGEEYTNPLSRRFHAQPNCCEKCGPSLMLVNNKREIVNFEDVIQETVKLLKSGKILAIKGIGGFHLVCDGRNERAIKKLRERKRRPHKPLAVMMKDLQVVKEFCNVGEKEETILIRNKRPIVLLEKKSGVILPYNIAPNQRKLGVMLPYTPLHYLLLEKELDILIMTSGNISGSPIEYKNNEALERLNKVADYFLMNNRQIHVPIDDSVVKVFNDKELVVRSGRGYAPFIENLGVKDNIIALGPEQKNTFSISKDGYVYTSQYLGDLKDLHSYKSYEYVLNHLITLLDIEPKILVQDMHPYYNTRSYANSKEERKIEVQHHHAHMASCMAEHNISHKVIGVIYDGTGFGIDGAIWGGEFFIGTRTSFNRVGHFQYVSIQGGDNAIKEPWRCAASYLYSLGHDLEQFIKNVEEYKVDGVIQALNSSLNCYNTSSVGRLFDAVSALIGLRNYITYDGQGAVELENIAHKNIKENYKYHIDKIKGIFQIEYKDIINGVIEDLQRKVSKSIISAKFHNTISALTCDLVFTISHIYELNEVVLSGGVFENQYLLKAIYSNLTERGFRVYYNSRTPINDGGISLGQMVVANAIIEEEER
jgi:[NiFe] hydrogenase maturation protein HypF